MSGLGGVASDIIHRGGCYCGGVTYRVLGWPILSAYCHCTLCQRLNASAFIHTTHFPASSFSWTHISPQDGALQSFSVPQKPWKLRWRCKNCGCCVATHNTKFDKWSVYGGQLERDDNGNIKDWDTVKPTAHIFYETRMLDIADGLGKWSGYENSSTRLA